MYCKLVNIEVTNNEKIEVTGDVFKSCMALSGLMKTGNYDAVIESIRGNGHGDQEAPTYEEVKNRLIEVCDEKKGSSRGDSRDSSHQRSGSRFSKRPNNRERDTRANFVKRDGNI